MRASRRSARAASSCASRAAGSSPPAARPSPPGGGTDGVVAGRLPPPDPLQRKNPSTSWPSSASPPCSSATAGSPNEARFYGGRLADLAEAHGSGAPVGSQVDSAGSALRAGSASWPSAGCCSIDGGIIPTVRAPASAENRTITLSSVVIDAADVEAESASGSGCSVPRFIARRPITSSNPRPPGGRRPVRPGHVTRTGRTARPSSSGGSRGRDGGGLLRRPRRRLTWSCY